MKVLIFGASGMVGQGVLLECLRDSDVTQVVSVGRSPNGKQDPKLKEILTPNVSDLASYSDELKSCDACFFCLGVSSVGMDEVTYSKVTFDLTLAVARTLMQLNPKMCFIYVSGASTDSTTTGRVMWARIKGKTENALLTLGFKSTYMFRPGFIQPMNNEKSKVEWIQKIYQLSYYVFPIICAFSSSSTTTENIGRAMLAAAKNGYGKSHIEGSDINRLGGKHQGR